MFHSLWCLAAQRKGMVITMKIRDRVLPVLGTVTVNGYRVPLLDIRMMSDERERELARKAVTA